MKVLNPKEKEQPQEQNKNPTTTELKKITLTLYEADLLRRPVVGIGGIQSMMRRLQNQLTPRNELYLNEEEQEKIKQYRRKYGKSGVYQQRLDPIVRQIEGESKEMTKLDQF